ncbi:hypothetical protein BZA05DRAFT_471624 [Tricharina praecox]|uniref:uncharacterized protein n=1 Tax=Tricharina praecox TaxID=43433 RepID=UPI00221E81ED|nr:uncharacterized protein BZA05DRAFT_471624 [Tricharina praecox]KAI5856599.1 hypothetical protein BZA05DRAFT_471624 [Tricharina praecox]
MNLPVIPRVSTGELSKKKRKPIAAVGSDNKPKKTKTLPGLFHDAPADHPPVSTGEASKKNRKSTAAASENKSKKTKTANDNDNAPATPGPSTATAAPSTATVGSSTATPGPSNETEEVKEHTGWPMLATRATVPRRRGALTAITAGFRVVVTNSDCARALTPPGERIRGYYKAVELWEVAGLWQGAPTAGKSIDNEETPESTDPSYMSDFRRYLIQRDTYKDKIGLATAEIRRSLDPSADIEKDFDRVAKIDANVGLYKLNAIRRADVDSAAAYHSRILEVAKELRNVGTVLPETVLAFYMVQGLPTGDTSSRSSSAYMRGTVMIYLQCTNTELSTALFAKKGMAKKKDGASGGYQDKDSKAI